MAQQGERGWPLGLQPLHGRAGLARNRDVLSGSTSFNTFLSGSPSTSCTDFSSDLDTESTESFFHDRSTTLGSLIGATNIVALSRRSIRGRPIREVPSRQKKQRSKTWCFSLCSKNRTDAENLIRNTNAPSLGQFLAVERRAADGNRRSHSPLIYGPDELALAQPNRDHNSLFVDGCVAPPCSSPCVIQDGNGHALPLMFACMCG
ncbi:hypothetical protein LIER_30297 [Lithospermum erythrorhizon]|uniref:Uncharacterized protein n=1 Tax=Lithospermum erythrorhizon TaxID=34254 RepID=A0AAV3RQR3_LITER